MSAEERVLAVMIESLKIDKIQAPPFFEMSITVFSLGTAVLLFLYPGMLTDGNAQVYAWMNKIMSQNFWAFTFFIAAILKAAGLMFDKNWLRYAGLSASAVIYLIMTVCYISVFPSLGAVYFGNLFLFTILSFTIVKHSGIQR